MLRRRKWKRFVNEDGWREREERCTAGICQGGLVEMLSGLGQTESQRIEEVRVGNRSGKKNDAVNRTRSNATGQTIKSEGG